MEAMGAGTGASAHSVDTQRYYSCSTNALKPAQPRLGEAPVGFGAWPAPRGEVAREPVHTAVAAMYLQASAAYNVLWQSVVC